MKTYYTESEIIILLETAANAGLKIPEKMLLASPATLVDVCNGVGSSALPELVRRKITNAYKCAEASAAIHDFRYEMSDGTPQSQKQADEEFLQNGLTEVRYNYPHWWQWHRWFAERKVLIAYNALVDFGESAWCVAFRNNHLKLGKAVL